jgi:hypothetical protein
MSGKTFTWKGIKWIADTRKGAPGPNTFNAANVFVKPDGVHMKIEKVNGIWRCATMKTATKLGYGTYRAVIGGYERAEFGLKIQELEAKLAKAKEASIYM